MNRGEFKEYAKLVVRAKEGDEDAFREIYQRTLPAQRHYLMGILGPSQEVTDALQDVYVLLYQNLDKINPPRLLVAYLNRISYYVGKNMERRCAKHQNHTVNLDWIENMEGREDTDVLYHIEKEERCRTVREAINELPKKERDVIFMRYYQHLKHQEVALSLDISLASAKRLQQSAQKHLRVLLEKKGITGLSAVVATTFDAQLSAEKNAAEKNTAGESASNMSNATATAGGAGSVGISPLTAAISASAGAGAVHAGAAALLLSAAILGGVSFAGAPSIGKATVPSELTAGPVKVKVHVDSRVPVKELIFTDENGQNTYGVRLSGNEYEVPVSENGRYRITAQANNGKRDESEVVVNCVDNKAPQVANITTDGPQTTIVFAEDLSGIDFEKVYCVAAGESEPIKPAQIHEAENYAVFTLSDQDHTLHFRDKAGNENELPLHFKQN